MSIRLVVVIFMLAAAVALGLIAFQIANGPKQASVAAAPAVPPPPATLRYLVASHPLSPGTLERDTDLASRTVPRDQMPPNAIIDDAEGRAGLLGALVQRYVDAGTPITQADILRPRERGFLAAVLTPGTRAVSVAVDPVSGVSGLIWPGDRVDVILTQEFERNAANPARRVISETVLTNVRVIAVDQSIAQGASYTAGAAGKLASTVTLQATTDQAERLAVARRLGALTLAIRAMGDTLVVGDQSPPVDRPPVSGEDVSPGLLHANGAGGSRVQVIQGDQHSEVTFR